MSDTLDDIESSLLAQVGMQYALVDGLGEVSLLDDEYQHVAHILGEDLDEH